MAGYALTVNGRRHTVESADPDMPLLWVLRDRLGLTGTKFGCGVGVCGACTVHVDGQAMRSCQVPVSSLAGHAVTTIEGLSKAGGSPHPCQAAWLDEDVAQCGYCQPGMIMTCAAKFGASGAATFGASGAAEFTASGAATGTGAGRSRASRPEVEAALAEHVCRCGTYARVRRALDRLWGSA